MKLAKKILYKFLNVLYSLFYKEAIYTDFIIIILFSHCHKSIYENPTKKYIEETNSNYNSNDTLPIIWDSTGLIDKYITQW